MQQGATEVVENLLNPLTPDRPRGLATPSRIDRTPGDVVGIGLQAKPNVCVVRLVGADEKLNEARGASQNERQHPARKRVERTRVPDAGDPCRAPHPRHDIVRRGTFGLVDDE